MAHKPPHNFTEYHLPYSQKNKMNTETAHDTERTEKTEIQRKHWVPQG